MSRDRIPAHISAHISAIVFCDGKQAFDTFVLASDVAKRGRRGRYAKNYSPYHCQACGKYHTGTSKYRAKTGRPVVGGAEGESA